MRKNFGSKSILVFLWCLFGISVAFAMWYITSGVQTISLAETQLFGQKLRFAIRIDALSSVILCMVSFLATMIGQYALRYLDGEPRQFYFYQNLFITVLAVSFLILSSNLIMFFLAWLSISWGLHRLLLIYDHRPKAVLAARKKLIVSRLGDLCLLLAFGFIYRAFGTLEFHDIFEVADRGLESLPLWRLNLVNWAGVLMATGAMTKSAQFPFHFWLPETMETPTPVSALMHAGIINAGGFLIIRLSPVFEHASGAGMLLTVVGAFTAVFGSLVMITQNTIKLKLAYSTISQMGMMMFACGIGAYSLALFHIIAHSLYKGYAFLSTGSLIAEKTKIAIPLQSWSLTSALFFTFLGGSFLWLGLVWTNGTHLPSLTYAAVLVLGLVQNFNIPHMKNAFRGLLPIVAGASIAIAIAIYLGLEQGMGSFISLELATLEQIDEWYHPVFLVNVTGYLIFSVGFCLSNILLAQKSSFAQRLYIYLWNGGYFGPRTSRSLMRIWPV